MRYGSTIAQRASHANNGISVGAVRLALFWLFRTRLSEPLRRRTWRIIAAVGVKPLHAVHSGHVGDYATWLTVGLTGLGAAFAYAIVGK